MVPRTRGVAPAVVAAVIVVVVVMGAVGGYYLLAAPATSVGPVKSIALSSSSPSATSATSAPSQASSSPSSSTTQTSPATSISTTASVCTTDTSAARNESVVLGFVKLFQTFSQATMRLGALFSGLGVFQVFNYNVLHVSAPGPLATYKVAFENAYSISGLPLSLTRTAWVSSNGTVLAVSTGPGTNDTRSSAFSDLVTAGGPFVALAEYNSFQAGLVGFLPPSSQTTASGESDLTLGIVKLNVTDYSAATTPLVFGSCSANYSLSAFTLVAGTVPGTNFLLLATLNMEGTAVYSTGPQSYSVILIVDSLTLANGA